MRRVLGRLMLIAIVVSTTACAVGSNTQETAGEQRPVVVIVVDALRADRIGTYGYTERLTTPFLDEWALRGRVFERAWATSPWTLPSFGSILTGRLPSAHAAGVEVSEGDDAEFEVVAARNFVTLPEGVPTLAAALSANGFATGALVTNPFLDPSFGLGRGFGFYDHYDTSNSELRPATDVVDEALRWIDERGERSYFLLVHLFDPHLDYDAPPPFRGSFTDSYAYELPVKGLWPIRNRIADMDAAEREFIAAAYDEELAYVDVEVGRLLAGLQQRGVLDSGLTLLTADHGEEFFEHGGFEHGHAMYEEVLRVPMIVWGAGVTPGRDTTPVSLLDVAPTVLDAAGVGVAAMQGGEAGEGDAALQLPGRSLLRTVESGDDAAQPIVAERVLYGPESKVIVDWPLKAILDLDSGRARLFDLAADPGELEDLAEARPDDLSRLLTDLATRLAAAEAMGVATAADIDEALLRCLRALGYIR